MSQNVMRVTCFVCRRKRRRRGSGDKDAGTYKVWLILELRLKKEVSPDREPSVDPALGADDAEKLGERLREAIAESVAGQVEEMVWTTADDLSDEQVTDFIAGLPDAVKTLVEQSLDSLAGAAGVPAPVALLGADVTAILLLKPVLEPIEDAVHALEVVGIVIGLVAGLHPLVITCVKHLAHDELGSVLTNAFQWVIRPSDAGALDDQPSAPNRDESSPSRALQNRINSINSRSRKTNSITGQHKAVSDVNATD